MKMEDIKSLEELKAVKVLGGGAMGTVFLVIDEKHDKRSFALKVISKSVMMKKEGGLRRIEVELDILSSSSLQHAFLSPFLGRLETEKIIAFLGEYCHGGDLNNLRHEQAEKTFSESVIRFYSAEIVIALGHLHSHGIAYRDLKPENILVQASGHIMLTDFDLSTRLSLKHFTTPSVTPNVRQHRQSKGVHIPHLKRSIMSCLNPLHSQPDEPQNSPRPIPNNLNSAQVSPANKTRNSPSSPPTRSYSLVGTEEYVAPEMLKGMGHDFAVDWWALGVLLYEMLYGKTPFKGATRKETFYNILMKQPQFSGPWTPLRDLIIRLLEKEPSKRPSVDGIKNHSFFKGLNWDTIQYISRPPFVPSIYIPVEEMMISTIDMEEYVEVNSTISSKQKKSSSDFWHCREESKVTWVKKVSRGEENNDDFGVF
eukprot:PITA_01126